MIAYLTDGNFIIQTQPVKDVSDIWRMNEFTAETTNGRLYWTTSGDARHLQSNFWSWLHQQGEVPHVRYSDANPD